MSLSTVKLKAHVDLANHMLSELADQIDRAPLIQEALEELIWSGENIVERFRVLVDEQPEMAKRVLMASIARRPRSVPKANRSCPRRPSSTDHRSRPVSAPCQNVPN